MCLYIVDITQDLLVAVYIRPQISCSLLYLQIGRMLTPPMFSRPFVLAPQRERQLHLVEVWGESAERAGVMFCAYCLSEDQRWLLAVVTDDRGELLETCTINIEIPNRNRRKKASARKIGLRKLWDFVLGVMSMTVHPWRLVIGRFGRMGHGELTGGYIGRVPQLTC